MRRQGIDRGAANFALVSDEPEQRTPASSSCWGRTSAAHPQGVDEETLRAVLARRRAIEMLSFPAASKVYLCTVPCDMRRSFDGLSMMAEYIIRCNPFSDICWCSATGGVIE